MWFDVLSVITMFYFVSYIYGTGETTDERFESLDDAIAFAKANNGTVFSSEDNFENPLYPR